MEQKHKPFRLGIGTILKETCGDLTMPVSDNRTVKFQFQIGFETPETFSPMSTLKAEQKWTWSHHRWGRSSRWTSIYNVQAWFGPCSYARQQRWGRHLLRWNWHFSKCRTYNCDCTGNSVAWSLYTGYVTRCMCSIVNHRLLSVSAIYLIYDKFPGPQPLTLKFNGEETLSDPN